MRKETKKKKIKDTNKKKKRSTVAEVNVIVRLLSI